MNPGMSLKCFEKRKVIISDITDGKGLFYDASITDADSHQCTFDIVEKEILNPHKDFTSISPSLLLKMPIASNGLLKKQLSLGSMKLHLFECDHTERQHLKVERLEKMAISAMKQSLKASLPVIHPLVNFRNVIIASSILRKNTSRMLTTKIQDHLKNLVKPGSSYLVLIGPEGDFSEEELILADSAWI